MRRQPAARPRRPHRPDRPERLGQDDAAQVIAGEQEVDDGTVTRANGVRVGWLPQDLAIAGGRSLIDMILSSVPGREELDARLAPTEAELEAGDAGRRRRGRAARARGRGRRAARAHRPLRAVLHRARGARDPRRPRLRARRRDARPRRVLGRLEDARRARGAAVPAARRAAARRADQPPRHAVGRVVRRLPQALEPLLHPDLPRPRVPERADRARRQPRARGRAQYAGNYEQYVAPARRGGDDPRGQGEEHRARARAADARSSIASARRPTRRGRCRAASRSSRRWRRSRPTRSAGSMRFSFPPTDAHGRRRRCASRA